MRLRIALLTTLVTGLVALPSGAAAGGWWSSIDLDGPYLGIGETVVSRTEISFSTIALGEEARGTDYHAYLVRGIDEQALDEAMSTAEPGRWWTAPEEMTFVGDVELSDWESNLGMATVHITVPEVSPGLYDLMLCDAGCNAALGDLIPLEVQVSADPLAAQTARKLERQEARSDTRFGLIRRELRRTTRQLDAAEAASGASAERIVRLQRRVSALGNDAPATPWFAYAGWWLAGVVTALLVMRSRRRYRNLEPEARMVEVPDDASEILSISKR